MAFFSSQKNYTSFFFPIGIMLLSFSFFSLKSPLKNNEILFSSSSLERKKPPFSFIDPFFVKISVPIQNDALDKPFSLPVILLHVSCFSSPFTSECPSEDIQSLQENSLKASLIPFSFKKEIKAFLGKETTPSFISEKIMFTRIHASLENHPILRYEEIWEIIPFLPGTLFLTVEIQEIFSWGLLKRADSPSDLPKETKKILLEIPLSSFLPSSQTQLPAQYLLPWEKP